MIKTKHKVSVVIPSAHNAYSVEQCLHAILEQKYTPAEILIIDSYRLNDVDKKRFSTRAHKSIRSI